MPEPTVERTLEVEAAVAVTIANRSGRTSVLGWERLQVKVIATVRYSGPPRDAQPYVDDVAAGIRQLGNDVYIEAPTGGGYGGLLTLFSGRPRIDYEVWMPRSGSLRAESRSGDVRASEIDGGVELDSRSGSIETAKLGSDLRASTRSGSIHVAHVREAVKVRSASGSLKVVAAGSRVEASAASGSIELRDVGGEVHAASASGSISLATCGAGARLEAVSGSIEATDIGGPLRAGTISGHLEVERCAGAMDLSSVSGSVTYRGPIEGDTSVRTVSGSVRLVLPRTSRFMLDAESRTGSIRSDLTVRKWEAGGSTPSAPVPKLRVRTISGSIRLAEDVGVP